MWIALQARGRRFESCTAHQVFSPVITHIESNIVNSVALIPAAGTGINRFEENHSFRQHFHRICHFDSSLQQSPGCNPENRRFRGPGRDAYAAYKPDMSRLVKAGEGTEQ